MHFTLNKITTIKLQLSILNAFFFKKKTISWQKQMVYAGTVRTCFEEGEEWHFWKVIVFQGGRPEKEGTAEEDLEKSSGG